MAPPVADDLLLSLSAKQRVTVQRSQEVVRSRVLLRSHTEAAGSAHYDYNPRREQVRGRAGRMCLPRWWGDGGGGGGLLSREQVAAPVWAEPGWMGALATLPACQSVRAQLTPPSAAAPASAIAIAVERRGARAAQPRHVSLCRRPRCAADRGRAGAPLAAGEATTPVPAGLAACTRRWGVKYRFAAPVHCPTACTALTLYTTLLLPVPAGNLAGAGCRQALRAGAGKLLGADGAGRRPVEHQLRPVRGRRHVTGLLGSRDWGAARDSIVRLAVLTPSSPVHGSRIKIEVHAE